MSEVCPFCAEPIEAEAEKCTACGESLLKGAPCKHHPDSIVTGACPDCGVYVCPECRPPTTQVCMHCADDDEIDASKHYELGEVLGLVFKDPDWVNHILIGAACLLGSFLIFPMFAFFGYRLRVIRQQWKRPNRTTLPTWDDFGELILDGFKWWLTIFLPIFLVMLLMGGLIGASIAIGASMGKNNQTAQVIAVTGAIVGYILLIVSVLAFTYVTPAIEEQYLRTGDVTSGLKVRGWWRNMSYDHVDYLIFFLYHYLITQILGAVGMVVCLIGMYASYPWAYYTEGAMFGRRLAKKDQQAKKGKRDFDAEFDSEEAKA